MIASVNEMSVQARDEEAATTQDQPQEKGLLDEGSVQAVEEDEASPAPLRLPQGEPAFTMRHFF